MENNEELKISDIPEPKKKRRGRPPGSGSKKIKEQKQQEDKEKKLLKLNSTKEQILTIIDLVNGAVFNQLPENVKKEIEPLSDIEKNELSDKASPVAIKYGWFDFEIKPEIPLILTSLVIFMPRIKGYGNLRKKKKQSESEEPPRKTKIDKETESKKSEKTEK